MIYLICQKNNAIYGPNGSTTLTEKEMALFLLLIKNKRDINEMINHIWRSRAEVINQNTLSQLAFRLRNKLREIAVPFMFTLSLSKGVRTEKRSRCVFISVKNKIMTAMLTRLFDATLFLRMGNNAEEM